MKEFEGWEQKDRVVRLLDTISKRRHPLAEQFSSLMRIQGLKDQDIEGKKILLRVHLKEGTTPAQLEAKKIFEERIIKDKEEESKRLEIEKLESEKASKDKKKGKRPAPVKKQGKKGEKIEEEK